MLFYSHVLIKDVLIRSTFSDICGDAEIKVDNDVSKDLLYALLHLYIRVRSHSYARQIREKHKQQKKEGRNKSLRTTIKQKTLSTDLGH